MFGTDEHIRVLSECEQVRIKGTVSLCIHVGLLAFEYFIDPGITCFLFFPSHLCPSILSRHLQAGARVQS